MTLCVNALPSRQRNIKAEEVSDKLEKTYVRSNVLSKLDGKLDCSLVPLRDNCKKFIRNKLIVDKEVCYETNTRQQSKCKEWFDKRKCRLTASMFGVAVKRRKSIYPKSILNTTKQIKQNQAKNVSCLLGTENEKNT